MTDHPITPPPEMVEQWRDLPEYTDGRRKMIMVTLSSKKLLDIATQAARWGADQELEACSEWLRWQNLATHVGLIPSLRAIRRRPKPPSLKEQALEELETLRGDLNAHGLGFDAPAIRRALEQLDD